MPEIKIVTVVAGRICATRVQVGGTVADGDDVVVVEAMKMEIPVALPASGTLKSLLVRMIALPRDKRSPLPRAEHVQPAAPSSAITDNTSACGVLRSGVTTRS